LAAESRIFKLLEKHPELRAPITEMILSDNLVAETVKAPSEHISYTGRPHVPDVHLLRYIRTGQIDYDPSG